MPSLEYNGHSVHYLDNGDGEPVVLLHAGASSARQWNKIAGQLPGKYRLIAPDVFGFGQTESWSGPGNLTHDCQAQLVSSLIDRLSMSSVHLVGHSYGGSTATRLVILEPDLIKSLVLIEPNIVSLLDDAGEHEIYEEYRKVAETFIRDASAGRAVAAWKMFVDLRNGTGTWDHMPETKREKIMIRTAQAIDGFRSNLSNPTSLKDCQKIHAPTLVLCGEKTTRPEYRITQLLAEHIPVNRYEVIPEAEHMSPVTHPEIVATLISHHIDTYSQ